MPLRLHTLAMFAGLGLMSQISLAAPPEMPAEAARSPAELAPETLTPLMEACRVGDLAAARAIVKAFKARQQAQSADDRAKNGVLTDPISEVSSERRTAIDIAASGGYVEIVSFLLDEHAAPFWWTHASALQKAVIRGDEASLERALGGDADANQDDPYLSKFPLHWAAEWGKPRLLRLLLSHGASLDRAALQVSPLWLALVHHRTDAVRLLLDQSFDPARDSHLEALYLLAARGDTALLKAYLGKGLVVRHAADDAGGSDPGEHALLEAVQHVHAETVKALVDAGVSVKDGVGLSEAAQAGSLEIVKLLLDTGASVETRVKVTLAGHTARWSEGLTPLGFAAARGDLAIAKLLIARGAELDPSWFDAPLDQAARAGKLEMVRYLVSKGARLVSAAHVQSVESAAESGHGDVVDYLIGAGASVDQALLGATAGDHVSLMARLLKRGASIDGVAGADYTPTGMAVYYGRREALSFLLDHGADPTRANADGSTPLSMAESTSMPELVGLLRKKIADHEARPATK